MKHPRHTIIPPYLLRHLAETADPGVARRAQRTLRTDLSFRADRLSEPASAPSYRPTAIVGPAALERVISTARNTEKLPGTVARTEGAPATGDPATDEAYDGFGATWTLFHDVYGRNSIDDAGMALAGTVHYGKGYDNAFWNGERMVFGDGDGEIFGRFTASLEVIGHELSHGVTERTAGLVYRGQPGALNEHISDVFGVLVKQHQLGQNADQADWLIGADLLLPGVQGVAIRSMIAPGTAYDDPQLGKDPQPDHMDGFVTTAEDNGGVHINSGIPNKAFALAAKAIGGPAWAGAGQVWYDVLTGGQLGSSADFATFAGLTVTAAGARFGEGSREQSAIRDGWTSVGVMVAAPTNVADGHRGDETEADDQPPNESPSEAELVLRRTGGVTGVVRERRTTLQELPTKDAKRWNTLLESNKLVEISDVNPAADGFCYQVAYHALDLEVTVAEQQLSESQRNLFRRTLQGE